MHIYNHLDFLNNFDKIINQLSISQKPIFIQSIGKPGLVIINLEMFFTVQKTYHAALKVLKK